MKHFLSLRPSQKALAVRRRTKLYNVVLGYSLLLSLTISAQKPELVVPIGHTERITTVTFSPDSKWVLSGSDDKTAKLWNIQGNLLKTFPGHPYPMESVAFSQDGKKVLLNSRDKTEIWDMQNGNMYKVSKPTEPKEDKVIYSQIPSGRYELTLYNNNTAELRDLNEPEIAKLPNPKRH